MKRKKRCGEFGISNKRIDCCSPKFSDFNARACYKYIQRKRTLSVAERQNASLFGKKGDKAVLSNYRHLSLLVKLYKKLLCRRLVNYSKKKNVLTPVHYRSKEKRSSIDAVKILTPVPRDQIEANKYPRA